MTIGTRIVADGLITCGPATSSPIAGSSPSSSKREAQRLRDVFDRLAREAGQLPIHVTYIMGLPYRVGALEALVVDLAGRSVG